MPRDWDARTYDRVSDPMFRWGASVVDGSRFAGDERVLDAGCGTGRVTEFLLERLPRGRVVALDGSPSMIDEARRRLERFGDRVTYVIADLATPLPLDEPVDAIVSTATFHWVLDHDALFANLAAALRPGGELMAQCGGVGNLTGVASALAELGLDPLAGKHFAAPEETAARLRAAGFTEVECWLHEEPTPFRTSEELEAYLGTVVLGDLLERMTAAEGRAFVHDVVVRMPALALDYVRLNIRARRSG